jgi:hypothetical protein
MVYKIIFLTIVAFIILGFAVADLIALLIPVLFVCGMFEVLSEDLRSNKE